MIRIRGVKIRDVGAIDFFSHDFPRDGHPSFFTSGNGVGKTTLLECLSLLGHLPCMDSVTGAGVWAPSYLSRLTGCGVSQPPLADWATGHELMKANRKKVPDSSAFEADDTKGCVRLDIAFDKNDDATITVLVDGDAIGTTTGSSNDDPRPTLTHVLSQTWSGVVTPDADLRNCFLVLHNLDEEKYDRLMAALALGRTFRTSDGWRTVQELGDAAVALASSGGAVDPIRVSYVNTDLNDFGRGNDLRESPKNLPSTFAEQMFARLRISPGGREIPQRDGLNTRLATILPPRTDCHSDAFAYGAGLELASLRVRQDGALAVKVRRGRSEAQGVDDIESGSRTVGFLSAGENEVVFLLLMAMILGQPMETYEERTEPPPELRGVLLLDEPDLHLANHAKTQLLREILALCRNNGVQVIACSHSIAPVVAMRRAPAGEVVTMFRRRTPERPGSELIARQDPRYLAYIDLAAWHPAGGGKARFIGAFRSALARQIHGAISPHYGGGRTTARVTGGVAGAVSWATVLVVPLLAALAIGNDIADVVFGYNAPWVDRVHQVVTLATATMLIGGLVTLTFAMGCASLRRRLKRRPATRANSFGKKPGLAIAQGVVSSVLAVGLIGFCGWLLQRLLGP